MGAGSKDANTSSGGAPKSLTNTRRTCRHDGSVQGPASLNSSWRQSNLQQGVNHSASARAGTASQQLLAPIRHRCPAVILLHNVRRCQRRLTSAGDDTRHVSSSAPQPTHQHRNKSGKHSAQVAQDYWHTSAGDDTGHLSSSAPRKVRTYSAGSRWSCAYTLPSRYSETGRSFRCERPSVTSKCRLCKLTLSG